MSFLDAYFEDRENGGLFHAMSEDFSRVVAADKHAEEQFTAARTNVIGAMITHDPEAIRDAETAVSDVLKKFEDTKYGGYFRAANRQWKIIEKEKNLCETGEIFGVLMHLYEVSKNDTYLLKALEFLDTALDHGWDRKHGGFFSLYHEDWKPAADTKDLATQATMLQHINGSWKDGMDSPYGARSAVHKKQAEQFGDLLMEKCADRVNGGFFTRFAGDWQPAVRDKEIAGLASFALTLYFHYHNLGPSIWGPRKGSHAYTGRPYPAAYAYRGPAPSLDPVGDKAYRFGKTVLDIGDLLLQHAWDSEHGGFYATLAENLAPKNTTKLFATQMNCLMALNVAYRLTGFKRFQQKLAEAVHIMEDRCFDPDNGGAYVSFERDWKPLQRDKICGPNLMSMGILSMMAPVVNDLPVTRQTLCLWIEPPQQTIAQNGAARYTVTVQNQGFEPQRVRIGGLTTPSRWMQPDDIMLDLAPHEVKSYSLTIRPPQDMPAGRYPFEITCLAEGTVSEYVAAGGMLTVR